MSLTLVTGAPGWLGTRLVESLFRGLPEMDSLAYANPNRSVRCLVKPGEDASILTNISDRIELVLGDINDPRALEKFCEGAQDAILFHCAGIIHPIHFIRELYQVNVDGTQELVQVAQQTGVRRVVAVSSVSPIGHSYNREQVFDETSPYNPYMNYGRSKMQMEQNLRAFQARGRIETVILRPTWFYGPGQPQRQSTFFQMIRKGIVPILGTGNNRRSMTYIDSLCQAILLSETNAAANGQTYWIADRQAYTVNEIVDTVERLMEDEFRLPVAHRRLRLPFWLGEGAMWSDRVIQGLGLYEQKIHVLAEFNKTIACSVAKAEKELGYKPRIELEEGMRRSIAWCLANNRPF